jgi:hypothetical protein
MSDGSTSLTISAEQSRSAKGSNLDLQGIVFSINYALSPAAYPDNSMFYYILLSFE